MEYGKGIGKLEFFGDEVVVALGGIACDEFADETCQEKLQSHHHCRQREIEIDGVGDVERIAVAADADNFKNQDDEDGDKTDDKHHRTEQAEQMHRFDAEARLKP